MVPGAVRARRKWVWAAVPWLAPVIVLIPIVLLVAHAVAEGPTLAALLVAPLSVLLVFVTSEATEQMEIHESSITVSRPPLRSIQIAAHDIDAIEKFTPSQWFVRSRNRRRPFTITLLWLENNTEVQAALVDLAERHNVPILETDMYRDTTS